MSLKAIIGGSALGCASMYLAASTVGTVDTVVRTPELIKDDTVRILSDIDRVLGSLSQKVDSPAKRRDQLFLRITQDPRFRNDRMRASDVLSALTLYGEARAVRSAGSTDSYLTPGIADSHRDSVHHALIYQTMVNRVRFGKPYLLSPDPSNIVSGFVRGTPAQAAVARFQYSCWNANDPNLKAILNPNKTEDDAASLRRAAMTVALMNHGAIELPPEFRHTVSSYYSPQVVRSVPHWARGREPIGEFYVRFGAIRQDFNPNYFLPFALSDDFNPAPTRPVRLL